MPCAFQTPLGSLLVSTFANQCFVILPFLCFSSFFNYVKAFRRRKEKDGLVPDQCERCWAFVCEYERHRVVLNVLTVSLSVIARVYQRRARYMFLSCTVGKFTWLRRMLLLSGWDGECAADVYLYHILLHEDVCFLVLFMRKSTAKKIQFPWDVENKGPNTA